MSNDNLSVLVIVAIFWLWAISKARRFHLRWFPNLLVVPALFVGLGFWFNRMKPMMGLYIVLGVHVLLLLMLLRVRYRRRI